VAVDVELFLQPPPGTPQRQSLVFDKPMTVLDVVQVLHLDPDAIGLIVIDGVQSELEDPVPPDCHLCFFSPLSGG